MSQLTAQQKSVLEHCDGHLVVLAGPGSGKTHTLIEKIFYLFEQDIIPEPYGLLAITFSNAAAGEMKSRLRQKGFRRWARVTTTTFHSFSTYLLRCYGGDVGVREDFGIIDPNKRSDLLQNILTTHKSSIRRYQFQNYIDDFKRQGIYPEHSERFKRPGEVRFQKAFADYQSQLETNNELDFADLIHFAVRLLKESELAHRLFTGYFRYIIVDEFQDTDRQQLELVQILIENAIGSTLVADDDQAIYGFRGARRDNIQEIQDRLIAEQIVLPENFRSPKVIVEAAQSVIQQDTNRLDKSSVAISRETGQLHKLGFPDDKAEALQIVQWVSHLINSDDVQNPGEIALVTRNRNRADTIIEILNHEEVPWFDRSRLAFQDTWKTDVALAVLQLACELDSSDSFYNLMSAIEDSGISYEQDDIDAIDIVCDIRENLRGNSSARKNPQNTWATLEISGILRKIENALSSQDDKDRVEKNLRKMTESIQKEATNRDLNLLDTIHLLSGINAIQLITSHGSKGKQFDYVFFIGVEDDIVPGLRQGDAEEELSEARRVFYVTLTRTRKSAYLTYSEKVGNYRNKIPSRFLQDIPDEYFVER